MKKNSLVTLHITIINSIIRFIVLQLFIHCISLPLLGYWGLPQSFLSIVGNVIFAPFLTFFLLFSTLIFFAYILCIPSGILIKGLEAITSFWTYALTIPIPTPFISCIQPPIYLCIILPLCALFIVTHPLLKKPFFAIPGLLFLLLASHAILYWLHTPRAFVHSLECNGGIVTLIKDKNTIIVIDPGVIGKRLSGIVWCQHSLTSELIKKTGNHTIDYFICLKPGKNIFDAITNLVSKVHIRHLYIPWWTNRIPPNAWRSYVILKKALLDAQCSIHFLSEAKKTILESKLSIQSTQEKRFYHEAQFPQFYIEGIIDNNRISIYAP